MTDRHQLEQWVRTALYSVAPDLEGEPLDPTRRFRDQFEFDSMDFVHYAAALAKLAGVEIPESDLPRLQTVVSAMAYLAERLDTGGGEE